MKVKEMIEELSRLPQEAEVYGIGVRHAGQGGRVGYERELEVVVIRMEK